MGRPRSCDCGECPKCKRRDRARAAYQALSPEERKALVARRDPGKVRTADRARYYRDPQKRIAAAREVERKKPEHQLRKKRWAQRNPEKRRAQNAVSNALRDGKLVKGPCEQAAGGGCRGRIEAHHDDYSKPLEVRWLCAGHHGATRREADRG